MRKVRSREYCHNCQEYSEWTFEERPGNQIIECPLCTHLHYRVVEGAYVDFEIEFRGEKIRDMSRVREVLEQYPETRQEFEELFATLEFGDLEAATALRPSDKRWGQDPRQRSWVVSNSTLNSWGTFSCSTTSSGSSTVYYTAINTTWNT